MTKNLAKLLITFHLVGLTAHSGEIGQRQVSELLYGHPTELESSPLIDATKTVKTRVIPRKASSRQIMKGATAIMVPGRLLRPASGDRASEYSDIKITQTEQARTISQFLHSVTPDEVAAAGPNSLVFGFARDTNKKKVNIVVNLRKQTLTFSSPDHPSRVLRIASGRKGHETERFIGCYEVKYTNANHRSREFDGAPMNNASFFIQHRGIAFHEGDLGSRSHGCVRLSKKDSKFVMDQINKFGKRDTKVCIQR